MIFCLIFIFQTLPGISNQGDRIYYTDARSLSLGSISSLSATGQNPALTCQVKRFSVSFTSLYNRASEQQGLRVYDSYGNNIGISTISDNTKARVGIGSAAIVLPFKMIRIGFLYNPLWDFHYYFHREYRDDFYQLTRTETRDHQGLLYSLAPMLSVSYKFLSIGVREDFIRGDKNALVTIAEPNLPDSIFQQDDEYEGKTTVLGLAILPNKHLSLVYSYIAEYTVESSSSNTEMLYPESHTIGFFYQPGARIPTRIYGEYCREIWAEPINIYKIGIEHTVAQDYALRYGFCVFPDYAQDAVWTSVFTVGGGYNTVRFRLDIAYSFSKRDYSGDDFSALEELGNTRLTESTSIFMVSLGFTL
jgi:hypothetical protein